ncbi:SlyX protein [Tranquillimonas rosea]|uniref:SlyX protein n=1 Tax=Tranquillimonas rosea TaxID=641238 RepID=A0A1H9S6V9_9RHOB|nr:SlyX family protein [Tranquillimonas rosea]SER80701.1 SlyX protein [Tranquillimonas rosea]
MTTDPTALQERIAHLEHQAEELSQVVWDQASRIDALERRLAMLMEREATRAADEEGGVYLGEERPPHW